MDLSKNKKRATRRKRNLIARDLIHNKEFRPKVIKPRAYEDETWKEELEEYYHAKGDSRRQFVREAKEGGTLSGVSSEDSSVSDRAVLEDREEEQEQRKEEEVNNVSD